MFAKIKALCDARKISIAKLERMADIGNGTLDNWDRVHPRRATLEKVAQALNMPTQYLIAYLGWSDEGKRRRKGKGA